MAQTIFTDINIILNVLDDHYGKDCTRSEYRKIALLLHKENNKKQLVLLVHNLIEMSLDIRNEYEDDLGKIIDKYKVDKKDILLHFANGSNKIKNDDQFRKIVDIMNDTEVKIPESLLSIINKRLLDYEQSKKRKSSNR